METDFHVGERPCGGRGVAQAERGLRGKSDDGAGRERREKKRSLALHDTHS